MENVELLNKTFSEAKNNIVNLGTANGWNDGRIKLLTYLKGKMIPGTYESRNLGRCYNEYSFKCLIDNEEFKIVFSEDSSD